MTIMQLIYGYVASEETYPDKTVIIEEGSTGNWVYVVLEGKAKVKKKSSQGLVTLDTLGKGGIFGEMALLEPGKGVRTASIVAEGPIRVGVLDTERLFKDYDTIPSHLKGLIKSLIMRLEKTTDNAVALAVKEV